MEHSKLIPACILILVIYTLCMVPINVLGKGYLPDDDALRHAAKAISGKDWQEILVLRPEIRADSHPGWHRILEIIYHQTGMNARSLVMLSVVMLFIWFAVTPLFFTERPEAWVISLLIIAMLDFSTIIRLFYGRPYIFTMSWVVFICFRWKKLKDTPVPASAWISFLMYSAASVWIHANWLVFGLPFICFLIARQWRAAKNFAVIIIIAIPLGACLSGYPVLFLKQTLMHGYNAFTKIPHQYMLVPEFRVGEGIPLLIISAILIIFAKVMIKNDNDFEITENPVFIMAASGYVLQFVIIRFWLDFGFPAAAVWIAAEIGDMLKKNADAFSRRRIAIAVSVCATFFIIVTADYQNRWSTEPDKRYISYENPEDREWMPDPGGIVYNLEMHVFYKSFYHNPHAPWRYVLGFEPALMTDENIEVYRNILRSPNLNSLQPYINKMTPRDRIVTMRRITEKPDTPGLDWHYMASNDIWIAKKSKQ